MSKIFLFFDFIFYIYSFHFTQAQNIIKWLPEFFSYNSYYMDLNTTNHSEKGKLFNLLDNLFYFLVTNFFW